MELTLRIFTHPACPRCGGAVKAAWELKEREPQLFDLQTVSLTDKAGLDEAHAEKVSTIPTMILTGDGKELQRIVGVPEPGRLGETINSALTEER